MSSPPHILLVTPIATTGITESVARLYPSTEAISITHLDCAGVSGCPPAIENHAEAVQSTTASKNFLTEYAVTHRPDGILISCYCDHPLVRVLHETTGLPVVGIFGASIHASLQEEGSFGIVTTTTDWEVSLQQEVGQIDVGDRFVGVVATQLGVLELESRSEEDVVARIQDCILQLVAKGAKNVILGCSGMAVLKEKIQAVIPSNIILFDGIEAGLDQLCELISSK